MVFDGGAEDTAIHSHITKYPTIPCELQAQYRQ